MLNLFISITTIIRNIISWPFRMLFVALGVANFKIIYKSGHVEYIFLQEFEGKLDKGNLCEAKWKSLGDFKTIIHFGINNIEAVYKLY